MNKNFVKLVLCFAICMIFMGLNVFANEVVITKYKYNKVPIKQPVMTKGMMPAVQKYKAGNYVGAMLDLEKLIQTSEPDNYYAKYYLALCYTQLGYKNLAQDLFKNITESNNYALTYYSQQALTCIDNPNNEICLPPKKVTAPKFPEESTALAANDSHENAGSDEEKQKEAANDEISKFIRSGVKINPHAMDLINNERMKRKIQEDEYKRKQLEEEKANQDASKTSYAQTPTNEEIVAALDVLSKVGLNPFTQLNSFGYAPYNISQMNYRNSYNPMLDLMLSNGNMDASQIMTLTQMSQNDILNYGI